MIKLYDKEADHVQLIKKICWVNGKCDWNIAIRLAKDYATFRCTIDETTPYERQLAIDALFNKYMEAITYGFEYVKTHG